MYVYKNNINDTSNKIIIPWQIIINFIICLFVFFFFFFQNVFMFFHVVETNSYCAAIFFFFFFLDKNTDRRVCVIFIWKMCKIVRLGQ